MLPLLLFILFLVGIEVYSFIGFRYGLNLPSKPLTYTYVLTLLITVAGIILMMNTFRGAHENMPLYANLLFGLAFSFIMAKLFASTLFLVEDIFRSFTWLFQTAIKFRLADWVHRTYLAGIVAASLSLLTIFLINYGVWFGRYHFKTHHITLEYDNLPDAFDGFRIAQISDLHLGTFDQKNRVNKGLKKLQHEQPDVILFTGDMVNNRAVEAKAFIESFGKLKAPFGKYSVLGNHDYGEYVQWESDQARNKNLDDLKDIHQKMGFRLLLNEHIAITNENDSIYIAGVENWGEPPFPQHGDLNKSISSLTPNDFIVLLSHDPTHWRNEIIKHPTNIELTLSGHTHGMQFGIEIGKFKWSPVKYRYADWAGLFEEAGRKMYVNRGYGSIGFPGRVGIRPEITIIELRKKK